MPTFTDAPDFLSKSTVLARLTATRQLFDPTNEAHLESLKTFVRTGEWGATRFYCEQPFIDVPMTVLMKFAGHHLSTSRESADDRAARRLNEEA